MRVAGLLEQPLIRIAGSSTHSGLYAAVTLLAAAEVSGATHLVHSPAAWSDPSGLVSRYLSEEPAQHPAKHGRLNVTAVAAWRPFLNALPTGSRALVLLDDDELARPSALLAHSSFTMLALRSNSPARLGVEALDAPSYGRAFGTRYAAAGELPSARRPLWLAGRTALERDTEQPVHVALTPRRSELPGAIACVRSVLAHALRPSKLTVHLLVPSSAERAFREALSCAGVELTCSNPEPGAAAAATPPGVCTAAVQPGAARVELILLGAAAEPGGPLALPAALPESVDRVLWLDAGAVVRTDLVLLMNTRVLRGLGRGAGAAVAVMGREASTPAAGAAAAPRRARRAAINRSDLASLGFTELIPKLIGAEVGVEPGLLGLRLSAWRRGGFARHIQTLTRHAAALHPARGGALPEGPLGTTALISAFFHNRSAVRRGGGASAAASPWSQLVQRMGLWGRGSAERAAPPPLGEAEEVQMLGPRLPAGWWLERTAASPPRRRAATIAAAPGRAAASKEVAACAARVVWWGGRSGGTSRPWAHFHSEEARAEWAPYCPEAMRPAAHNGSRLEERNAPRRLQEPHAARGRAPTRPARVQHPKPARRGKASGAPAARAKPKARGKLAGKPRRHGAAAVEDPSDRVDLGILSPGFYSLSGGLARARRGGGGSPFGLRAGKAGAKAGAKAPAHCRATLSVYPGFEAHNAEVNAYLSRVQPFGHESRQFAAEAFLLASLEAHPCRVPHREAAARALGEARPPHLYVVPLLWRALGHLREKHDSPKERGWKNRLQVWKALLPDAPNRPSPSVPHAFPPPCSCSRSPRSFGSACGAAHSSATSPSVT